MKAFGAKGDGSTDDTSAIRDALLHGRDDVYSTLQPALVYLPPGTYKVSDELRMYFYTHMVGNYKCRPKIVLAPGSGAKTLIAGPPSCDDCQHTGDFYYQFHNIDLDLGDNEGAVGMHWAVSQGSSVRNVTIDVGKGSKGIFTENGSGGWISDVEINGGDYGMQFGNQQWVFRSVTIRYARISAILLFWDWVITFQDFRVESCPTAFVGDFDSLVLLDSQFVGVDTVINATGKSVYLDRVSTTKVNTIYGDLSGSPSGNKIVSSWFAGQAFVGGNNLTAQGQLEGDLVPSRPDEALLVRPRPTFDGADVVSVRSFGAKGDGIADDTQALQAAIDAHDVVFIPFGTYLISSTVSLRSNTVLVGELFSKIVPAPGASAFADASAPTPLLTTPQDDSGSTKLVDLSFVTLGDAPGCQVVDWGVGRQSGMWDVHFRIEHNIYGMLQLTGKGGGYFENMWGWSADHYIDGGGSVKKHSERGMLVSSEGPTWMYGLAFEHSAQYQFALHGAQDVTMVITQTETPYWQNGPTAWGLSIRDSQRIHSFGSGHWNWLFGEDEDHEAQKEMDEVVNSQQVYLYSKNVINTVNHLAGDSPIQGNYSLHGSFAANIIAWVPSDQEVV